MIKIDRFPHAHFDSQNRLGYLALYYPLSAIRDDILSEENWRQESYSPEILNYKVGRDHDIRWFAEILNYKVGRDHDIRWFVEAFLNLIYHAISSIAIETTCLVPVTSSIGWNDPKFSSQPRPKGIAGTFIGL
ncbi:MAG: hypothetical protein NTV34_09840 [Proteobacteria bacterium]|nr:hypothetical protein [Pseudomonadota bacterium]